MGLKKKEEKAADALIEQVPQLLLDRGFTPDNCILSTRLAIDALQQVGIRATAVPCSVVAFSPELVEHMEAGGELTPDAPGWSVGIGVRSEPIEEGGYNGHLITVIRDSFALDLSLGQAARPEHKLDLRACGFDIPDDFLSGEPLALMQGEAGLLYQAEPERKDYAVAPDWAQTLKRYPEIVQEVREIVAKSR